MTKTNVVIGLGGTGGHIIKFLKKRIELDSNINKKDIFVDYIYVDSDMSLINNKAEWKILGKNTLLGNSNIVHLDYMDMNQIFRNPDDYRYITSWLGSKEDWNPILENFTGKGKVYGQQKRRLGRFLFASSANKFKDTVNTIVQDLQDKAESVDTTFYICSGLAGGTGSGSLIDTIVQVKKLYPRSNILLFLFLPERNPGDKDAGNYHLNGYACLKELNDLDIGAWKPHDLTSYRGERTKENSFFKKAYIITEENANSVKLNPKTHKPEEILADYIHQRIFGKLDFIDKIEDSENIVAGAETDIDNDIAIPVRSRSFITFGIKRIIFPKEEIREYLTYKTSYNLLLSILYNNWNEINNSYEDRDKHINIDQVLDDAFKTQIKFTENTLTLQDGVLNNEDRFISFNREWETQLNRIKESQKRLNMGVKDKFDNIFKMLEDYYNNHFRGKDIGVDRFFENAESDATRRADKIIQNLEEELFASWLFREEYSIKNIEDIVTEFLSVIEKEIDKLKYKRVNEFENIQKYQKEIDEIKDRFANAGIFTNKTKIYNMFENSLLNYYLSMTRYKSLEYAIDTLLPLLKEKASNLLKEAQETNRDLTELKKEMQDSYLSRLNSNIEDNKTIYKVFNKKLIDNVLDSAIIHNQTQQDILKTTIVQKIRDTIGSDNFSFKELNSKFDRYSLLSYIEKELSSDIINYVERNANIINKNIVDELEEQYRGKDDNLKNLIIKTINSAKEFLPFNKEESQRRSPITKSTIYDKNTKYIILLPLSRNENINSTFREKIKNTFNNQREGDQELYHIVDDLYKGGATIDDINVNENEILLIKVVSTFPLRVVDRVKFLADKYKYAHKDNPKIDLEIHLEGSSKDFNSLYIPDREEYQDEALINILILLATENLNLNSDNKYELLIRDNHKVVINKVVLDSEIRTIHKNLNLNDALIIRSFTNKEIEEIKNMLKVAKKEKKEKIIENLINTSQKVEEECKKTGDDIVAWGKRFAKAIEIIEKL